MFINDIFGGLTNTNVPVNLDKINKLSEKMLPSDKQEIHGGLSLTYNFPNGYTGSVVCHSFSYGCDKGLMEIAVKREGMLVYDTDITDDVIGYLDIDESIEILKRIENL